MYLLLAKIQAIIGVQREKNIRTSGSSSLHVPLPERFLTGILAEQTLGPPMFGPPEPFFHGHVGRASIFQLGRNLLESLHHLVGIDGFQQGRIEADECRIVL